MNFDFLKNVDLQNIKYSDAVSIMKQLNSEMEKKVIMEMSEAETRDYSEKMVESLKKEKKLYGMTVIMLIQKVMMVLMILK